MRNKIRLRITLHITSTLCLLLASFAAFAAPKTEETKLTNKPNSAKQDQPVKPAQPQQDVGILGIKIAVSKGQPTAAAQVFKETPAWEADIRKDDLIMQVDGASTINLDKEKMYRMMTGKPDTAVKLTIRRGNKTFEKSLTRIHSAIFAKEHPDIWKIYLSTNR